MSTAKAICLVAGALFEFVGIVVMVFPDAFPYALQLSTWLRKHTRAVVDRVRRLLGRPRHITFEASTGGVVTLGGRATLLKGVSGSATLEQKVDFLLRRDQEAQRDVDTLREKLEDLAAGASKRLDEVRREMETRFAGELTTALEAHRPLRVLGTLALLIGLGCATYANFID